MTSWCQNILQLKKWPLHFTLSCTYSEKSGSGFAIKIRLRPDLEVANPIQPYVQHTTCLSVCLFELHWLPTHWHIQYKLTTLTHAWHSCWQMSFLSDWYCPDIHPVISWSQIVDSHIDLLLSISVFVALCQSISVCVCLYSNMSVYICLCMSLYHYVFLCVSVCLCLCSTMSVCVCLCITNSVCVCLSVCVHVVLCQSVYVCLCMSV